MHARCLLHVYDGKQVRHAQRLKGGCLAQGEDGVAQINFPNSARGFRDFILVDDEVQVTVGNRGSVVVIRRK